MVQESGPGALDALLLRHGEGGGEQWEEETPAPENVELIACLDAIRPIPSNEQYVPSFEFDFLSILQSLAGSSDDGLRGNMGDIVRVLSAQGKVMKSRRRHLEGWKKGLQDRERDIVMSHNTSSIIRLLAAFTDNNNYRKKYA